MSDKQDDKEIKVTDKRRVTMNGSGPAQKAEEAPPVEEKKTADEKESPRKGDGPAEFSEGSKDSSSASRLPVTFLSLIFSLASSAMIYLGELADPDGKPLKDIEMAKQTIDLLGILAEKTRGNLDPEEEQFLSSTLRDLRLRFVQVRK